MSAEHGQTPSKKEQFLKTLDAISEEPLTRRAVIAGAAFGTLFGGANTAASIDHLQSDATTDKNRSRINLVVSAPLTALSVGAATIVTFRNRGRRHERNGESK